MSKGGRGRKRVSDFDKAKNGFTTMLNEPFFDNDLNLTDKMILWYICRFNFMNSKELSLSYLCECIGISPLSKKTISLSLNILKDKNYIEITQEYNRKNNDGRLIKIHPTLLDKLHKLKRKRKHKLKSKKSKPVVVEQQVLQINDNENSIIIDSNSETCSLPTTGLHKPVVPQLHPCSSPTTIERNLEINEINIKKEDSEIVSNETTCHSLLNECDEKKTKKKKSFKLTPDQIELVHHWNDKAVARVSFTHELDSGALANLGKELARNPYQLEEIKQAIINYNESAGMAEGKTWWKQKWTLVTFIKQWGSSSARFYPDQYAKENLLHSFLKGTPEGKPSISDREYDEQKRRDRKRRDNEAKATLAIVEDVASNESYKNILGPLKIELQQSEGEVYE